MTDSQTHLVFAALADPTRRLLFEQLCNEWSGTATSFAAQLPITRQAVTKHLTILAEAGLVAVHESGRERRYMPHPEALQSVATWIGAIEAQWDHRLAALRSYLLDEPRTPSTPEEEHAIMASQKERVDEHDPNHG
ncbi:MAG TPA: helix-turn-helix domain-containing protein [Ktedonobacteraceae bacterium]|nr:helix-turn-helix domain-containing protein [Ktedonobacteraceae bacterium]